MYTQNGILNMLDRNRRIKHGPQRLQATKRQYDLILTAEERVYDQVLHHFAFPSLHITQGAAEGAATIFCIWRMDLLKSLNLYAFTASSSSNYTSTIQHSYVEYALCTTQYELHT